MAKLIIMYILFLIILCHGILQISPAIYRPLIALEALPPRALVSASDRYSDFKAALFQTLYTAGQRLSLFALLSTGQRQAQDCLLFALWSVQLYWADS